MNTLLNYFRDESLTKDQQLAYTLMTSYNNIFITGQAGTGKSTIIEKYYKDAVKKYGQGKVFKTSTTGISALNIGGRTIHSWAGIGLGQDSVKDILKNMLPAAKSRILSARVLFIDEVSMLDPDTLDKIFEIIKTLRTIHGLETLQFRSTENEPIENENCIHDLQFILVGDFFQLPVVASKKFCFEAKHWPDIVQKKIELKEIVRQADPLFQKLLNEVRVGKCSEESIDILKSRINADLTNEYGILPTKLYPTNNLVDMVNSKKLEELIQSGAKKMTFTAKFRVDLYKEKMSKENIIENFKKVCSVHDSITLTIGTQIMVKKNLSEKIVNGTRGVVSAFINGTPVITLLDGTVFECPVEEFSQKTLDYYVSMKQIPLKLAWATTIHASQGSTIDLLEADIGSKIFEYGQVYVVLSRVRKLEGLSLISFDETKIMANPKIIEFYKNF